MYTKLCATNKHYQNLSSVSLSMANFFLSFFLCFKIIWQFLIGGVYTASHALINGTISSKVKVIIKWESNYLYFKGFKFKRVISILNFKVYGYIYRWKNIYFLYAIAISSILFHILTLIKILYNILECVLQFENYVQHK